MSNEQGGLAKSSPTRSNVSSFWTLSDEKKRLKIFKNFYAKFACFVASCLVYLSVWGWPLYETMCFPLGPWGPSGLLNVSWVSSSCSEKILSNPYKSCFFFFLSWWSLVLFKSAENVNSLVKNHQNPAEFNFFMHFTRDLDVSVTCT